MGSVDTSTDTTAPVTNPVVCVTSILSEQLGHSPDITNTSLCLDNAAMRFPHCSTSSRNARKHSPRTSSISRTEAIHVSETERDSVMTMEPDTAERPSSEAEKYDEQTAPPARKRGRPGKTVIITEEVCPHDAEPSNSLAKQTKEQERDSSPLKKRGRPNKTAIKSEKMSDSFSPPKRRGRSKKFPAETQAIPDAAEFSHSHAPMEPQTNQKEQDSGASSRKRGRSRKTAEKTGGTGLDRAKTQKTVRESSVVTENVSARARTRFSLRTRGKNSSIVKELPEEATDHPESDSEAVVVKKRRGRKPSAKPDQTEVPREDETNPPEKNKPKKKVGYVRKKTDLRCKAKNNLLDKVEVDANGEPGICTRCGNIKASMDHFLRVHNAMLAEEERTFDLAAKRLRYLLVKRKRQKLRCQIPTCRKVMMSVTAMVYHEQSCGKTQELIICPQCEKLISRSYFRQHELEHDRSVGNFKRKKHLMQMPNFGTKTMDSHATGDNTKDTALTAENEPSTSINSRPRRTCAIAAAKKLRALITGIMDDSDFDEHYENNRDSSSEESSDDEGESESEPDDQKTPLPTSTFLPSPKFPRMDVFWKQSLTVLNYALCYNPGCDFVASSFAEMFAHHKRCDFGRGRNRNRILHQCTVERCGGRFIRHEHLIRHYMTKHGVSQETAKRMAKEKRIPHLVKMRKEAEPSQTEIDALRLFE